MKSFKTSTQFRKDLKRYRNNPSKLSALHEVLKLLKYEQPIPAKYKSHMLAKLEALKEVLTLLKYEQPIPAEYLPHMLSGNYKGCMECHVQGDFLLIWVDEVNRIIELVRLGTHAELFR